MKAAVACLDDNTAVEFASGEMPPAATAKVESHLATCKDCRTLVAALAPAPGEPDSDLATPLRPARGKRGARDLALASTEGGGKREQAAEPVVAVGDTIGRYVVLRRIGAGGMGVVFAAYDPQLDRRVALKLLRTGNGLREGEARVRLIREAKAIAQLSHPHVVAVYDVGTAASGEVYVAMEFVEGDTLTQWLHRWERSWRDVLGVFRDAGLGLAAAHGVGLLHRDFKPDNVLVGSDGRVRVSDFGLARSLVTGSDDADAEPPPELASLRVTLTATGAVMGTPRYMAPEQLQGKDVTAAADQFSFCVALYEALYGAHPFPGDTAAKMIEEGARMRPPPDGRGAPGSLTTLLARGLDPVPARRFPSMNALLAELAHAIAPPRRRLVAIVGAAALVLGGAAAATVIAPRSDGPRISQDEVRALQDQIAVLEHQKQELIGQIEIVARESGEAKQLIEVLSQQVAASSQKIVELQDKLAKAGAEPPPVRPVRPAEPGVSLEQLRVAVRPVEPDLGGCFAEWDERSSADEARLVIHVRVYPDGHVRTAEPSGLDDTVARACAQAAASRLVLPVTDVVTVFDIDARYLCSRPASDDGPGTDGHLVVTLSRQGTEPAPPLIDTVP